MPPTKKVQEEVRSDISSVRERQLAAAAHARKSKNGTHPSHNGTALKEQRARATADNTNAVAIAPSQQGPTGMHWPTLPLSLLNTYRVAHHLPTPAAFTTPLNQARLTNPGIGRQSPTMARAKAKRRVSRDALALAVRKHFNGAAVSEIDVVVEWVYRVRCGDRSLRMRSSPVVGKK